MEFVITGAILAVVIGIIAYIGYLDITRAARRTQQFGQVAKELGFDFLPEGDAALLARIQTFGLGAPGRVPRLINLLRGTTNDRAVSIFDFDYSVGHATSNELPPQKVGQTVILIQSRTLNLPAFVMASKNILDKLGTAVGVPEITFASHPDFSRQYQLRVADEAAVRDVFTARVLDHFQTTSNLTVEGAGDTLLVYREGKYVPPGDIPAFLSEGFAALTALHG